MQNEALKRRNIGIGAVFVLFLSAAATAQQPFSAQPTETDLHAAYCTQYLTFLIDVGSTPPPGPQPSTVPDPNDPPAVRESKAKLAASNRNVKASLGSFKAMLRKLDLYLKPRMIDLEQFPLVAAKRAAQEDWDRFGSAWTACDKECPLVPNAQTDNLTKCHDECVARAMPDLPMIQKKTQSCQNLEWLPF